MLPFAWLEKLRAVLVSPRTTRSHSRRRKAPRGSMRLAPEPLEARDVPALTLVITPDSVSEAAGANAATGTLTRDGDLTQPLSVLLTSSDTTEAAVPSVVTIAAGQAQVTFPIEAVDDTDLDGTQTVTVTASAQVPQGLPFGLDPTFGTGGLSPIAAQMVIQFPHAAIARQPDGKVLGGSEAGGTSWQITRLNADGSRDTAFGTNGVVVTSLPTTGGVSRPVPYQIVVQPDGKILVGGSYESATSSNVSLAVLARYNADGTLDTTFGTNGIANLSQLINNWIEDIALRPDGRILLGLGQNGTVTTRVAQLNANGTPDTTFGTSQGTVALNLGYTATQVAILPDGKFLAAGSFRTPAQVAKVNANGIGLDTTFGTNGVGSLGFGTDNIAVIELAFDSQGRIVLGGSAANFNSGSSTPSDFAVGRLTANGIPDTSFAGDGSTTLDINALGGSDLATGMVIQSDGKILLGGLSDVSNVRDSALARFNTDGTPDTTLDGDGGLRVSLVNTFSPDMIFGVTLQPDGKLLALTGWATDIRVARFNPGPQFVSQTATDTLDVLDNEVVNQPPVANNQSVTTNEDTAFTGTVTATDPDGDPLQYAVVALPAHGTLSFTPNGSFTYTPDANYNGPDSFTFQATDGEFDSNVATVSITVSPVNDAPTADNQTVTTDEDTPVTITPTGDDVDGDILSFAIVSPPAHGTITENPDGTFTYTPAANYNGPDEFTFEANDGTVDSSAATVSITVNPVNDAPVANNQSVTTSEDTVLNGAVTATDPDGDSLQYVVVTPPAHGMLILATNGSFTYTPAANYNGPDSFTFQANDGQADSNVATVSIAVSSVNDAPTLAAATFTLPENSASGTVVGTVSGSDVDGDTLTYSIVGGNTSGAFAINATTGQITVLNPAVLNFEQTPTFTLSVQTRDPGGLTSVATITVHLTDVPENQPVTIDILPGNRKNEINIQSHGTIEVAILSTASFDARTVNVNSLRFGRTGQENSLSRDRHGPRYRLVDVNHDGRKDLVVEFEIDKTDFRVGDTKGILTGKLLDGTLFSAEDQVTIKRPGHSQGHGYGHGHGQGHGHGC